MSPHLRSALAAVAALAFGLAPTPAHAAGPPTLGAAWATDVLATSARLHAEIDPEGLATTYRFEYLTEAAFQANGEGFAGAAHAPAGVEAGAGAGSSAVPVKQSIAPLSPATAYRYRVVATNSAATVTGTPHLIVTQPLAGADPLLDGRGWEMVSPIGKGGGQVGAPEGVFAGGQIQAAEGGGALTFSSLGSLGGEAQGAPGASQYLATRAGSGWQSQDSSATGPSGGYGAKPDGVPYRLFSSDLSRALMLEPRRCEEAEPCPRSYSLRDGAGAKLAETPALEGLTLEGATPDLTRMAFSTPDALYIWGGAGALVPIAGAGATPAAPLGALSTDGDRLYAHQLEDGPLALYEEGRPPTPLPGTTGVGAAFQVASADGLHAFYTAGSTLYRYSATDESSAPIATGVSGVLGASADGTVVFFQTSSGLERWQGGTTTEIAGGAAAALPVNWPPASGSARVSADGAVLAFLSKAQLTGYDNTDQATGQPDAELFAWRAGEGLMCVSCNPTNQRPLGGASVPGAPANGSSALYRPRVMSAGGSRLFFESDDALALTDTNGATDVYEWEGQGIGDCAQAGGCLGLVSSGRAVGGDAFLDASVSGADAYFLTSRSLVGSDTGAPDVYDAREGGGFPEPPPPLTCAGDACQSLPSPPDDPEPGTLFSGPSNPALSYPPLPCPKGKHRARRGGRLRCVGRGKIKRHKQPHKSNKKSKMGGGR